MKSHIVQITSDSAGQRLDNFLVKWWKGVPKSRIYRAVRAGEVRVNSGRVKVEYRLSEGDQVRLPPLRVATREAGDAPSEGLQAFLETRILQETPDFLLINKPMGMPVHGGTGLKGGLIEAIRMMRPSTSFLELVHRLDKDTSGCLLLAKKRKTLLYFHEQFVHKRIQKRYIALVKGAWLGPETQRILLPLRKAAAPNGERHVVVDQEAGKASETVVRVLRRFRATTCVEVSPVTGRTHQIRVHLSAIGHPIVGDTRYGDADFNQVMRVQGLRRLFLHAASLQSRGQDPDWPVWAICAPLDEEWRQAVARMV